MNDERRPARNAAATTQPPADDNAAVGPRLVIEIGVEGRPRVRQEALNPEQAQRLAFWVKSQPRLHRLVYEAARLARETA